MIWPVIEDIKTIFKGGVIWRIQYTTREGNNAAHQMAKLALSCEEESVWLEQVLDLIKRCIHHEKHCND